MAKSPPIRLMWLGALADHLAEARPSNHTSILAVAVVLQKYGDNDGTSIYPSQATMAHDAGMTKNTVKAALRYLSMLGFLTYVGSHPDRTKEYMLSFPEKGQ